MGIITEILQKKLLTRAALPQLLPWLDSKEALVFTGARQVGKTSLMYLLIQHLVAKNKVSPENIVFLDLEKLSDHELCEKGPEAVLEYIRELSPAPAKKYLFIDEIQYLQDPAKLIKLLVDHYSKELKIFASGSSTLELKKKFKDSLVGRKIYFEIYSLNFREYLNFIGEPVLAKLLAGCSLKKAKSISNINSSKLFKYFEEYTLWGGYPAVVLQVTIEKKKKYLDEIHTAYVRKDIRSLYEVDNLLAFNKLLKRLSLTAGSLFNAQEVSKELGIDRRTVDNYVSILENTYILKLVQPYYSNKNKEIVKMPKVYFLDTGLRNRVINDFRSFAERTEAGALLENAVYKNLLTGIEHKENLKFWRLKSGVEVDFVREEEGLTAYEVKLGSLEKTPKGLKEFIALYTKAHGVLLHNTDTIVEKERIKTMPYFCAG